MIRCWNCGATYRDSRAGYSVDIYCHRCGARPREVRKSLFIDIATNLKGAALRQFMEDARVLTDPLSQALIQYISSPECRLKIDRPSRNIRRVGPKSTRRPKDL